MGSGLAAALSEAPALMYYLPSLAQELQAVAEDARGSTDSEKFALPDIFIRPFRAEVDSRHEYKTPEENAIYNERERCFDEFSNVFASLRVLSEFFTIFSEVFACLCESVRVS